MTSEIINKYKKHIYYRNISIIIVTSVLMIICFLISLNTGYSKLSMREIFYILLGKGSQNQKLILFQYRLPRIIISALIGAGLSLSGCIIQGISGNPLSDPGLLGINSGAGLMVILYALLSGVSGTFSIFLLPFLALVGAGVTTITVYLLAYKKHEGISNSRLILTGIAVQSGLFALTVLLIVTLDDMKFSIVAGWQAGQIWGANWSYVLVLLFWMSVLIPFVILKSKTLDILIMGDEIATSLGVNVEKERRKLLAVSVMLSACCVAVGGNISFVGLISPHLARRLVGSRNHILLPVSVLIGAVLVCMADTIGRTVIQPSSIPTGIMVAIIGAPYFIYLLTRKNISS